MRQASCSADTTAYACHTLDEVSVKHTFTELKERKLTSLNAVANDRLDLKVDIQAFGSRSWQMRYLFVCLLLIEWRWEEEAQGRAVQSLAQVECETPGQHL